MHYLAPENAPRTLRSLKALTEPLNDVKKRARKLIQKLKRANFPDLTYEIRESTAAAGGGSLPTQDIPTVVVAVKSGNMTASRLEAKLRQATVPIIVRVDGEEILLDLRTVAEDEFGFIIDGLLQILAN